MARQAHSFLSSCKMNKALFRLYYYILNCNIWYITILCFVILCMQVGYICLRILECIYFFLILYIILFYIQVVILNIFNKLIGSYFSEYYLCRIQCFYLREKKLISKEFLLPNRNNLCIKIFFHKWTWIFALIWFVLVCSFGSHYEIFSNYPCSELSTYP